MKHFKIIFLLLIFNLFSTFSQDLKKDILFLTSGELKGRTPGTFEDKIIHQWLCNNFKEVNLEPYTDENSYIQEFNFKYKYWYEANMLLMKGKETISLIHNQDFQVISDNGMDSILLNCIFIGYATDKDCLEKVQNKAVILFQNPPGKNLHKVTKSDLQKAGAKMIINVLSDESEIKDRTFKSTNGKSSLIQINLKKEKFELFFDESDTISKDIFTDPTNYHFQPIDIDCTIKLSIKKQEPEITTANIIGEKKGENDQYIIIGAHYDHLGVDPKSNLIFHGANDNASGIALLLELSRRLKNIPTQCNLVFTAFGAEEVGMKGSKFFIENCPKNKQNIKAMVNLDVIGMMENDKLYFARFNHDFIPILNADLTDRLHLILQEKDLGLGDHIPFLRQGIPTLFFNTGVEYEQLHTVEDKEELLNYPDMYRTTEFVLDVIQRLDYSELK